MSLKIKDKLSALLNNVCDDGPGVVLMARFDDGKEYYLGRGKADVERGIPVSKKTVFNIASLSKQFTAFCIHLLENAGEISLDDGVKNYIPELPDYANSIKIDNLIHHTSGLKDYIDIAEERGVSLSGKLTPAESLKDVCDCNKPDFIAGHEFAYSNTNYFLLSIIIERITGKKISQYAREMIFSPLNMNDTFYNESYPIVTETAKGYSLSELTGGYEHHESLWTQTGDGAVYSTPEDLMKWGGNFSNPVSGNSKIIDSLTNEPLFSCAGICLSIKEDAARACQPVLDWTGLDWTGRTLRILTFTNARMGLISTLTGRHYSGMLTRSDRPDWFASSFLLPEHVLQQARDRTGARMCVSSQRVDDRGMQRGNFHYERGAEVRYYTGRIYCGYLFKLQTEEKVLTKS
ncbi:serine hydrolase domain-containing protein [Kosakonia cowanii]|uniref:serine hydrolase domain-containing protein n=1 Tax=Kosakonia cowanii TaxID=208223 RepID=UPI00345B9D86